MAPEAAEILQALPLFSGVSEEAIGKVAERTVIKNIPRNGQLFRRGEACHGLYVVVRGRIRVYRATPDGREQVLHVEGRGPPVAELPLFDWGPYPASARAVQNSRVLFLSRERFQWLYQNNPEISAAVIWDVGKRLRRLVRLVEKYRSRTYPLVLPRRSWSTRIAPIAGGTAGRSSYPGRRRRSRASWRRTGASDEL